MRRYVLTMRTEAGPDTRQFRMLVAFAIALGAFCALFAFARRRASLDRAAERAAASDGTAPAAPAGTDVRRPPAPAQLARPATPSGTYRGEWRLRRRRIRRLGGTVVGLTALALALGLPSEGNADTGTADEIHYTFTGP